MNNVIIIIIILSTGIILLLNAVCLLLDLYFECVYNIYGNLVLSYSYLISPTPISI